MGNKKETWKKGPGEKLSAFSWALDVKGTQLTENFQIAKCCCWVAVASQSSMN